MENVTKLR